MVLNPLQCTARLDLQLQERGIAGKLLIGGVGVCRSAWMFRAAPRHACHTDKEVKHLIGMASSTSLILLSQEHMA